MSSLEGGPDGTAEIVLDVVGLALGQPRRLRLERLGDRLGSVTLQKHLAGDHEIDPGNVWVGSPRLIPVDVKDAPEALGIRGLFVASAGQDRLSLAGIELVPPASLDQALATLAGDNWLGMAQ